MHKNASIALQGHANVARLLMERGAQPDVLDFSHRSLLALAAGGGYADCVHLFLSDSSAKRMLDEPTSTACADLRGRVPLHIAAGRGHVAVRPNPVWEFESFFFSMLMHTISVITCPFLIYWRN